MSTAQKKKSGFCLIAGRSNVGKSTLLNAFVGTKVAITSPKAQTTRFPIRGIVTDDRGQIVFVDSPGVLEGTGELTRRVNALAKLSFSGVDAVLYVVDPTRAPGNEEKILRNLVLESSAKTILVINKIDAPRRPWHDEYLLDREDFDAVVECSAKDRKNLSLLIDTVFELLPEGERIYPEGQFSDLSHEVWLAEIIREKIFLQLRNEVPYQTHVRVISVEERPNNIYAINAVIEIINPRYRPIIIGKGGQTIKSIGRSARIELEGALQRKVYLALEVVVNKHWPEQTG